MFSVLGYKGLYITLKYTNYYVSVFSVLQEKNTKNKLDKITVF